MACIVQKKRGATIDFHFDINDRKVESTDKPGVDEGVDKNNCALFK